VGIIPERRQYRSRRIKALLTVTMLVIAALMTAVFINYRQSMQDVTQPGRPADTGASLSINQFKHTAMKNGNKEWTMQADTARFFAETRKVELKDIDAVFFTQNDETIKINMTASHGEMDMNSKNIRAWEDVVVYHPRYTLKTESLSYAYDSRIMIIDAPLEITGEAVWFTADAGRYELDTETITFEGNIESRIGSTFDL